MTFLGHGEVRTYSTMPLDLFVAPTYKTAVQVNAILEYEKETAEKRTARDLG